MKQRAKINFYEVTAKCGHVGRNRYCLKPFYVAAPDGRSAAQIVRDTGRVKHHHKDAIRDVAKISAAEYLAGRQANGRDPYFLCSCVQEQRMNFDLLAGCIFEEARPTGRGDGAGRKKWLTLRYRTERKEDKYGRIE